ncbi:MAG TPA: TIGR03364 family FAD-dependent oxidoreductase [Ohtaekwangia sp.]|nr:TIGR03364 family FAD-dependent oxidoreductase [Ohtaekwangia sp.]
MDRTADIAIVGAGIVGLAHAYMALKKGLRVVLFERDQYAVGASIRNFGLLWPVGQEPGTGLDRALRGRQHWDEISRQAGIWNVNNGSLHLAYHDDEMDVVSEFVSIYRNAPYDCTLLSPSEVQRLSPVVRTVGLKGGLYSRTESTVYSRDAIKRIPVWLQEKYGLILRFGNVVTEISIPLIKTSREVWKANQVIVCSGADFETLYPAQYEQQKMTKCKLQMLKAVPSVGVNIGPSLCAGLTLRHYAAFAKCPSLPKLDRRFNDIAPAYQENGVHVLVAQNQNGELIIGDSHEYGNTVEPFDRESIYETILSYLKTFTNFRNLKIIERWNGVYPSNAGRTCLVIQPEKGVTLVNGLGGAGMTLSFGLAEDVIEQISISSRPLLQ